MFNNTYKTIGLIICDAAADVQKQFCTHMVDYTRQKGYNLAIFTSFNDYTRNVSYMIGETNITNLVPYESFDGMIFISETFKSGFIHDKLISNIKNRCRCPIINVRSELEGFHIIDVDTDTAMDEMIRHFICTHKKEKIAFINGPEDHVDAVKRLECFRRVMKGYDLPIREDWIIHSTFWRDEGERYFNHFFDKPREEWPEVIMCANDHMALALSDICMDNGIEIPNDIAISGFDNSSVSATCYPPVSTVSVPIEDLAKVSVDVIERINNGENVNLKTYIGAVNIYRDSCGCYESDVRSILKGIREPRKEYDNLNDIIIRNTFMSIELEQVDEFEDIGPRLDVLGYGDRFINDFFVCICEDATDGMSRIVPRVNGYTSSMRCICAIKDRKNEAMSSFPTSSLIPINIAYTEPKQFYFTPLHFLDNIGSNLHELHKQNSS